ncbi:MAG: CRISPR-associated protein Cas4 [Clostridia bacterium]|nr:CRISPR-associated protein Cas4 [Clostridia bacterium]
MEHEMLMLSGIQHFAFCRRQWALIHVEQQWAENLHTAEGDVFHRRAHDETQTEMRGDTLIVRGLRVQSERLGISGICDVVEFHRCENGVTLAGREGRFSVYPIEYKKGAPKAHQADELQLCAQAMCLEEMLLSEIPEGSLFYGETRRRVRVSLTQELRAEVTQMLEEMHQYFRRGYTPKVRRHKGCSACSLKELCLPGMQKAPAAGAYLRAHVREEEP